MHSDPFSEILTFVNAQSVMTGGFSAGGAWALGFPAPDKIKFFGLVKGQCWLWLEGEPAPVLIEAGDVFLLCAQRSFVLASDVSVTPLEARQLFANAGRFPQIGDGQGCVHIGGYVQLDPESGGLLANALPPLIHVRATAPQAAIVQWLLGQLAHEGQANLLGASLASAQLAQLMFIQILRAYVETSGVLPEGWLRTVSDPRLAPALRLMHGEPGSAWTLQALAAAAAMSRTTFSQYFKRVAGVPPLTYLTEWRMRLAQRALREGNLSVGVLAQSLGYGSESAFSNAFKRVAGKAPRHYREAFRQSSNAARLSNS
ncbi:MULTISPECIES: AraC family transcriptional regulator [unclassified Pseudomonas]|uniref:AraC family transcriptional regulator n=1 Tax=unclassified Pseudomonas TaxID=196821 RepID=UPI0015A32857|nr:MULTISPECIES: AraC family transcriptional regulator [unclassified Pseudomonas]NWC91480.1 AraC family transcriptional regulator [Pseudomonas sp. IPO3779]NWD17678.1 AraC family transcriptional regulator [Pseudomonas sp. IPO3778]